MNTLEQLIEADKAATPAPWQEKPENKYLTILMRNNIRDLLTLANECAGKDPENLSDEAKKALEALQK